MELKSNVIALYSRPYSVLDDVTKVTNKGISIQYIMTDNLLPQETEQDKGLKSNKGSLPLECEKKLTHLPAVYEATFTMKTNSNGKPELAIKDLNFKGLIMMELDDSLAV